MAKALAEYHSWIEARGRIRAEGKAAKWERPREGLSLEMFST